MKRFIIIIQLFLTLALSAQEIRIRVPDTSIVLGEQLLLPVYADSSLSPLNAVAYQIELSYNANVLEPVGIVSAGTLSDQFSVNSQILPGGVFRVAGAGSAVLSGSGILFFVRFNTMANGNLWLDFNNGVAANYFNEGGQSLILDRGYIQVKLPPDVNVTVNSYFTKVGDNLQSYANGGTAPYTFSSTVPGVAAVDNTGLVNAVSHGAFRVKAEDNDGYTDSSNLVVVSPFLLTIPDTTEWQGGHITLPVYYQQLSTVQALSGDFTFTFNGNILLNPSLDLNSTLLSSHSADVNISQPGKITVAFAGSTPLGSAGVLCYIKFDVSAETTGYSNINFSSATFNEMYRVFTDNGSFRTVNWATINVNGNNFMMAGETYQYTASGGVLPYTWNSSDASLVNVNSSGQASALMGGTVYIQATDDVGASGKKQNIPVYDLRAYIPDTVGPKDGWVTLPVYVTAIPNSRSYSAYELDISFNANYLEYKNVITTATKSENWSIFAKAEGNGLKIAAAGSNQISTAGVLLYLQFALKSNFNLNQVAYVNFSKLVLNEGTPTVITENGSGKAANITPVKLTHKQKDFNLYPNPSNGTFLIECSLEDHLPHAIELYDLSGKLRYFNTMYGKTANIQTGLEAGVYILKIHHNNNLYTNTVIIR